MSNNTDKKAVWRKYRWVKQREKSRFGWAGKKLKLIALRPIFMENQADGGLPQAWGITDDSRLKIDELQNANNGYYQADWYAPICVHRWVQVAASKRLISIML